MKWYHITIQLKPFSLLYSNCADLCKTKLLKELDQTLSFPAEQWVKVARKITLTVADNPLPFCYKMVRLYSSCGMTFRKSVTQLPKEDSTRLQKELATY